MHRTTLPPVLNFCYFGSEVLYVRCSLYDGRTTQRGYIPLSLIPPLLIQPSESMHVGCMRSCASYENRTEIVVRVASLISDLPHLGIDKCTSKEEENSMFIVA